MAKYYKFDSGLTLLYESNTINKSTSVEIYFDCGARVDGDLKGLAHFCEHMLFSGTNQLSKQEVAKRYFDFFNVNAYTGTEYIAFVGVIMTSRLGEYFKTVHDMITNSPFTKQSVEDEKKIVIQEIVENADRYKNAAYYYKMKELFDLDYYKDGVLGTKQSVSQITSRDVKNYIKKYFVKNNCVISICTPLSFNKVKNIIRKHFDSIMPSNNLKPFKNNYEKAIEDEKICVNTKQIDKNFLTITFKNNRKGPDLKYRVILSVICNMIDDISDGLTKDLRINNSLIYSMYSDYLINFVNSYFELNTEICTENIKPCIDVIFDYIKNLRVNGFTQAQLDKEIIKKEYYQQIRVETPDNIRNILPRYRFYGRFVNEKDINSIARSLTLDEINQTMRELFDESKIQVFVYGDATK
ncbi:MAG: M16 family metallopeptidase, partial [Clostridia bacterium]